MAELGTLAITHTESVIRSWLGGMAAAELVTREARYPEMVEQGKMTRDAAVADIAAWRSIAALFATGEVVFTGPGTNGASLETSLSWGELVHAARIQFAALCRSCDADPADLAKRERRDAVQAILARLEWQRDRVMARPSEPAQGKEAA